MKGKKQARINLDRLRAGNDLKKSNEQLRLSLAQNSTPSRCDRGQKHYKMGLALGGLALGALAFGAVQCSNRETGVHQCWQSQIPGVEEISS